MSIDRIENLMAGALGDRGLVNLEKIGVDDLLDLIGDVLEDGAFTQDDEGAVTEFALTIFDEFVAPRIRRPLVRRMARSGMLYGIGILFDTLVPATPA